MDRLRNFLSYSKMTFHFLSDSTCDKRWQICVQGLNLKRQSNEYLPHSSRQAKSVKIHPEYIQKTRNQNDIALIRTIKEFDFSHPEKISPLCLPGNSVLQLDDVTRSLSRPRHSRHRSDRLRHRVGLPVRAGQGQGKMKEVCGDSPPSKG